MSCCGVGLKGTSRPTEVKLPFKDQYEKKSNEQLGDSGLCHQFLCRHHWGSRRCDRDNLPSDLVGFRDYLCYWPDFLKL